MVKNSVKSEPAEVKNLWKSVATMGKGILELVGWPDSA
jgi:hypothetical protein